MRAWLWLAVFATLLVSAPPPADGGDGASSPIVVGSEVDFPPYAIVDANGRASGFSVELLEAVAESMGLSLDVRPGPWPEVLTAFKEGRLDLLPLVALSPQRAGMAAFTAPHTIAYDSFFVRRGAGDIHSLEKAKGKAVIVMADDAAHERLVASGVPLTLVETRTIPEAMRLLASGRHDAVLVPKLLGHLVLRDLKLESLIEAGPPLSEYQRRFAFAVQPGNFDLRDRLDQGIAIVRATGRYDELYDKWFGNIEPRPTLTWYGTFWGLAAVGAATGGLVLLSLGWSLSLRRQVVKRTASLAAEVAARRTAESSLSLITFRYADLVSRVPVGVYIVSFQATGEMKFEYVSPRFCQLLGVNGDAVRADASIAFSLAHPDDRDGLIRDNATARDTLAPFRWEGRFIVRGEPRFFRIESDPTPLARGGSRWNGVVSDVTERKQAEARIMATNRQLNAVNDELKQFVYAASHDLRAPLRTVTNYLGLITRKLGPDIDDEMREFVGFAMGGAKRMDAMIVGLLEYSRTGRSGAPFAPVALGAVVQESLDNLQTAIHEAEAEVTIAPDLPTVQGDYTELVRLFQNLIGNAVKYRVAGRPPEVSVSWRGTDAEWVVWVKDNGIGIDPAYSDRVFEIFRRLVSAGEYEGSGIGLAVCRKVAEHHGGRIWVESVPGEGSTFLTTFPKAAPVPEPVQLGA